MVYLAFLAGGMAGSLHCIGMCGGFPLALGAARRRGRVVRQLLYNLGRLNAYAFIGAVSGALGASLVVAGPVAVVERVLAIVAGLFMIAVGAEMLGFAGPITRASAALVHATVGRLLAGVMRSPSPAAPIALGVFNAFLPCHLVYAFAAQAASTASIGDGALTMAAFGVGTVPAMLALGLARWLARPSVRWRLSMASALLVIGFGALTVARGLDVLPHHHAPAALGEGEGHQHPGGHH